MSTERETYSVCYKPLQQQAFSLSLSGLSPEQQKGNAAMAVLQVRYLEGSREV